MILITGPLYSGKHHWAEVLQQQDPTLTRLCADVQEKARDCPDKESLTSLADTLATEFDLLLFTETGCGVVPVDPQERLAREQAGRLGILLAERADLVFELCCGIPKCRKGEWTS
ncbi:MAG: bifunctional adenosylcobinamide kinase/adenosylcobinamide-phosphate guanylyltransferase [Clostridia bacterium]|nr:bifunctional adenosylcobinamide kinase/adenosylcobinamide-phosphate guanylyltransferase [Clostridia bacterium]